MRGVDKENFLRRRRRVAYKYREEVILDSVIKVFFLSKYNPLHLPPIISSAGFDPALSLKINKRGETSKKQKKTYF